MYILILGHHTTKRSIDLTATSAEIPKEKSLNPNYPTLFLDSDRTVGNLAAKLKPLTDGSDKDGLEKDGNRMDWLGGETAKELLGKKLRIWLFSEHATFTNIFANNGLTIVLNSLINNLIIHK